MAADSRRPSGRRHRVNPDDPKYADLPIVQFGPSWPDFKVTAVLRGNPNLTDHEVDTRAHLSIHYPDTQALVYRSRRNGRVFFIPVGKLYRADIDLEEEARYSYWDELPDYLSSRRPADTDGDDTDPHDDSTPDPTLDDYIEDNRRHIKYLERVKADGWELRDGRLYDTLPIEERIARNAEHDSHQPPGT